MKTWLKAIEQRCNPVVDIIESIIFGSRWILVFFYLGLILAQLIYCFKFCCDLFELCRHFLSLDGEHYMLIILGLIDITMIANLIKMIIAGSYQTFVNKIGRDHTEKISSGALKVKMGSSIIGVSSIHLLKTFMDVSGESTRDVIIKCSIHVIIMLSTVGLAFVNHLHTLESKIEKEQEHEEIHNNGTPA